MEEFILPLEKKTNKWPKNIPVLSEEQLCIKRDFMKYWHEVLPRKYGIIERFNHGYPVKHCQKGRKILEIGAGLGEHISYENLEGVDYYALELLPEMAQEIGRRFPKVQVIVGDCQQTIAFPDNFFDRVVAIHVLEHLSNLPTAIKEVHRVLKTTGEFAVVIPCEGGWAYSLARAISAQRLFKKRYRMNYDWLIKSEHINKPKEIIEELRERFEIKNITYFPFFLPSINFNLVIGLVLSPKDR